MCCKLTPNHRRYPKNLIQSGPRPREGTCMLVFGWKTWDLLLRMSILLNDVQKPLVRNGWRPR